jgi:hypothetical protein
MNDSLCTYQDIFTGLGTEYLLVILVLIVIIGFWRFVNMDAER